MRTNSNKKVHKIKRDPFKSLLRVAAILAAVVVVGIGVFYLCGMAVNSDYRQTRSRIEAENAEAEVEFNARMNELRNQNRVVDTPNDAVIDSAELPFWEKEIEGKLWRIEDEGNTGLENTATITLDRGTLLNGGLLLVNAWHSLPADFSEEGMISVGEASSFNIQVQDNSVKLFQPAYNALQEALNAAKEKE